MFRNWTAIAPLALATATLFLSPGCASILSKSTYPMHVDSQPRHTNFEIVDHRGASVATGVTPKVVSLKANRSFGMPAKYRVKYWSQNGRTEVPVETKVDPMIVGNILVGGVPGLVVDAATGAMYKLPESVQGRLDGGASLSQNDPSDTAEQQPNMAEKTIQPAGHFELQ